MKVTINLENNVVGENLIEYVKDSLNDFTKLLQIDCNFEIVNYKTRPDIEEDDILFTVIATVKEQVLHNLDTGNSNPPTLYKF
jgi:hypothetical protein